MLPLVPPSALFDLSTFHDSERTMPHHPSTQDPDGLFADDDLTPDPVFMALRRVWETGPLARMIAWLQREPADEALMPRLDLTARSRHDSVSSDDEYDRDSRDLAA